MDKVIWTNNDENRFEDLLKKYGEKADKIFIASAFFTETKLITEWTKSGKNVEILVRLMPPTSYDSLNEIYQNDKISIWFLGKSFHSKFYVFFNNEKPFAIVIGSSNFTGGGLRNNIETNAILKDSIYLDEIERQISELKGISLPINEQVLEKYRQIYLESEPIQRESVKVRDLYNEIRPIQFSDLKSNRNNSLPANKAQNEIAPQDSKKDVALNLIHFDFWEMFINESNRNNTLFENRSSSKDNLITKGVGMVGLGISLYITKSYCGIVLFINRKSYEENKDSFDFLEKMKPEIENQFGSKLIWNRMNDEYSSRIRYQLDNVNVTDRNDWDRMILFLIDSVEKMVRAFKNPIKMLKDYSNK